MVALQVCNPNEYRVSKFTYLRFFYQLACSFSEHCLNSLTRVVTVRHHWIHPFVAGIRESVKAAGSPFCVDLSGFEVFVNDEGTRTFVGVRAISGTCHLYV